MHLMKIQHCHERTFTNIHVANYVNVETTNDQEFTHWVCWIGAVLKGPGVITKHLPCKILTDFTFYISFNIKRLIYIQSAQCYDKGNDTLLKKTNADGKVYTSAE